MGFTRFKAMNSQLDSLKMIYRKFVDNEGWVTATNLFSIKRKLKRLLRKITMNLAKATLCLCALLSLGACSDNESAESYLIQAKNFANESKTNEAVIALKNAIRIDNNNGEARFLLGKAYLKQGSGVEAVKELERAKRVKYINDALIPLLARAYILTDSDADVIALSDSAKKLEGGNLTQYLAYKTLAALRSEDTELADASVKQANTLGLDDFYTKLAQAYLAFAEQKFTEANTQVQSLLEMSANNPEALMLQGQIASATKEHEKAADSFQQYLEVQPKSGIVQLLLADSLLQSEQYKKAEQHADAILASVSTQPFANYIKAMVRFQDKDYKQASEYAEIALSANFNHFNLKLIAGASAFHLKNWEQTNRHISAVAKYLPPEHQANKMLAISQLELGLVNDISETLNNFSTENESDSQFIASLSYKLLELGAVNEAKALVEKNDAIDTNAEKSARQGILKLMMNDPSGMQNLEDAVKLDPKLIQAELALAFAAVKSGDIAKAKAIANKWEKEHSDKAGAYNLRAIIYLEQKNFIKAEEALNKSLSKEKDNVFALIELVRSARLQEKLELAKERANDLIVAYPNNDKAQRIYFDLHRNESAMETILSSYKRDSGNIKKAILATEALISLEKFDEAHDILKAIESTSKLPKRYWQLLLFINKQQRNEDNIRVTIENWKDTSPYHLEPFVLLVDFYTNKRDYSRALGVVNSAFDHHPENLTLQLIKMQLLLNTKELYQAKALYQILTKRDINKSLKMGLEGRLLLLEGKHEQAIHKLNEFYQAYPSTQNAIYLVSAYQGNSDESNAIKLLEAFLTSNEKDDRARVVLASLYLKSDKDKAIESYEKVSVTQSKSIIVNNNLAWLYMEKDDLDSALKFAEKAYDIAPDVANVVDTYSQILLKKGDKRNALKKAAKAFELSDGKDIDIHLNYIDTLLANSRKNEAKTLLNTVEAKSAEQQERVMELSKLF